MSWIGGAKASQEALLVTTVLTVKLFTNEFQCLKVNELYPGPCGPLFRDLNSFPPDSKPRILSLSDWRKSFAYSSELMASAAQYTRYRAIDVADAC